MLRPGASLTASKDYLAGRGASTMAPEVMEVNRAAKEKGGTALFGNGCPRHTIKCA